jgi:hypothetical protein
VWGGQLEEYKGWRFSAESSIFILIHGVTGIDSHQNRAEKGIPNEEARAKRMASG